MWMLFSLAIFQRNTRYQRRVILLRQQIYLRFVTFSLRGNDEIFERATEPDIHLTPERIDASQVAFFISVESDLSFANAKKPGLRVVRISCKNSSGDQT